MPNSAGCSNHYTHGNLAAAIRNGIEFLGKTVSP